MKWLLLVLLLAGCAADDGDSSVNAHMNGRTGFYTTFGSGIGH